jgi:tetratricopeptide (TPR) repeat protein
LELQPEDFRVDFRRRAILAALAGACGLSPSADAASGIAYAPPGAKASNIAFQPRLLPSRGLPVCAAFFAGSRLAFAAPGRWRPSSFASPAYWKQNRPAQLEWLDEALAAERDAQFAAQARDQAVFALERPDEALAQASASLSRLPRNVESMDVRSIALLQLGHAEAAYRQAAARKEIAPNKFGLILLGSALLASGRAREAIALGAQQVALAPASDYGFMLRARAQMAEGPEGAEGALADLDAILARHPADKGAMFLRALALGQLGPQAADEALRQALALLDRYPNVAKGPELLAWLFFRQGKWSRAIAQARLFPSDRIAALYGGRALAWMGRAPAGVAFFKLAKPDDELSQWGLAEAYYYSGQRWSAQQVLKSLWQLQSQGDASDLRPWPLIAMLRLEQDSVEARGPKHSPSRLLPPILRQVAARFGEGAGAALARAACDLTFAQIMDEVAGVGGPSIHRLFWLPAREHSIAGQSWRSTLGLWYPR